MAYVKYITFRSSAASTAADAELLSDWVDVDDFNELVAWLDVTAFASRADETLNVSVERWSGNTAGYTTLFSFTEIATTGAHSEEKQLGTYLGGKIRMRAVLAGTWSSKSITWSCTAQVKCA